MSSDFFFFFFEFCSNWLRLIMLCENITLFWSCRPGCLIKFIYCSKQYIEDPAVLYTTQRLYKFELLLTSANVKPDG